MVIYNGKSKYTAPKSFWELFAEPALAKQLLGEEYGLVDLQATSDDKILHKKHLGMFEYFLKHIHQRDMLELWEDFLEKCKSMILMDKENNYIYIKSLIWYSDNRVPDNKKGQLEKLIIESLPEEDGERVMRTIADSYRDEGEHKGIAQGIAIGKNEGIAIGDARGVEKGVYQR